MYSFLFRFVVIRVMTKSISTLLLSCLLGSFFYLILGWLVFDIVVGAYTEAHTTALEGFKKTTDFSMPFLYASCLAYSLLINFVLFHTTITSIIKAISFSAIVGVLVGCMTDFFWYASSTFYSNFTVVCLDLAGAAVSVGALGGLSFVMLRKK
jgi:hypothetical protein